MLNPTEAEMKRLEDFFTEAQNARPFSGCKWFMLDRDLAAVCACDDSGNLYTKIAFNCDNLQCDYDYDWEMPANRLGEVYDTDSLISGLDSSLVAADIVDEYNNIVSSPDGYLINGSYHAPRRR